MSRFLALSGQSEEVVQGASIGELMGQHLANPVRDDTRLRHQGAHQILALIPDSRPEEQAAVVVARGPMHVEGHPGLALRPRVEHQVHVRIGGLDLRD